MKSRIIKIISYLLIFLFVYAATNKLIDIETFKVQLGQSPLLTPFAEWVSWLVPGFELLISVLLLTERFRLIGLYAGYSLMVAFTAYVVAILGFSDFVPCSCGGILEKLGWKEHLVFNIGFVILAGSAVILDSRTNTNAYSS